MSRPQVFYLSPWVSRVNIHASIARTRLPVTMNQHNCSQYFLLMSRLFYIDHVMGPFELWRRCRHFQTVCFHLWVAEKERCSLQQFTRQWQLLFVFITTALEGPLIAAVERVHRRATGSIPGLATLSDKEWMKDTGLCTWEMRPFRGDIDRENPRKN